MEAARRLIAVKGPSFTTQELVREAGIALQTFYRYFPGKDHLLLAVIEDIIGEACLQYEKAAAKLTDPVERLHFFITSTLTGVNGSGTGPSFITAEHWRLQTLYPNEVSHATQPFTQLLLTEINAATAAGELHPMDPEYSAWLVTQLTMAVFHHYDSAGLTDPAETVGDRLWKFCLGALGGSPGGAGGGVKAEPARPGRTRRAKA